MLREAWWCKVALQAPNKIVAGAARKTRGIVFNMGQLQQPVGRWSFILSFNRCLTTKPIKIAKNKSAAIGTAFRQQC